ncbi:hypothetical protein [Streptomyces sp. NPDC058683]|uniref:hypothetical protein n=1 Tax=Streptomyces sp. NPDC058683 TaxID=3346597 RepID=UPI003647F70F
MSHLRARGKHFASEGLLRELASLRARLAPAAADDRDRLLLERFLAVVLDKWDGAYSYQSYLAIDLIDSQLARVRCDVTNSRDEWVGLLLADVWTFEDGARNGAHDRLPQMRPDSRLMDKRARLIGAALTPVAERLQVTGAILPHSVGGLCQAIRSRASPEHAMVLELAMQPVHTIHDEYLFIRVLQSFEVTFAAMGQQISEAILRIREKRPGEAAQNILWCRDIFSEARTLFSLLATMQVESFRTFRVYTDGASAIQSESYKYFEARCGKPARERLDSPAFEAVPKLREEITEDWSDLSSTVREAAEAGLLDPDGLALVRAAAEELEKVHQRWKQTHWRLGVRMIGDERGTGYTVGVPYLEDVIGNRLFRTPLGTDQGALRGTETG